MIYIDLDADLNMEDDDGRNFARVIPPLPLPVVGDVLVAGRPTSGHGRHRRCRRGDRLLPPGERSARRKLATLTRERCRAPSETA